MSQNLFNQLKLEAYKSTNGAMILETTYRRKGPFHGLADSSSDDQLCVCITLWQIKKITLRDDSMFLLP